MILSSIELFECYFRRLEVIFSVKKTRKNTSCLVVVFEIKGEKADFVTPGTPEGLPNDSRGTSEWLPGLPNDSRDYQTTPGVLLFPPWISPIFSCYSALHNLKTLYHLNRTLQRELRDLARKSQFYSTKHTSCQSWKFCFIVAFFKIMHIMSIQNLKKNSLKILLRRSILKQTVYNFVQFSILFLMVYLKVES